MDEQIQTEVMPVIMPCLSCDQPIAQTPHRKRKRFCDPRCRMAYRRKHHIKAKERPKMAKRIGRPPKITPDVRDKLIRAFAIGATDKEACAVADISCETLWDYEKRTPGFRELKDRLKELPTHTARETIIAALPKDKETAKWYLERKLRSEFGPKPDIVAIGLNLADLLDRADERPLIEERKRLPSGSSPSIPLE